MATNRDWLLMELLHCGEYDLSLLDNVDYDWCDIIETDRAGKEYGSVIWSNGGGWEHVSVSPFKKSHTPTWDEMCSLKDMFFHDDEVVVQYHPAKSEYVNNMTARTKFTMKGAELKRRGLIGAPPA